MERQCLRIILKNYNILLRFNDFEDAYLKKDEIVSKIEERTGGARR